MKPIKNTRTHGFTLVELMVVIAIIGTLAMIAIPNYIGWLPRHRLSAGTQDVLLGLNTARSTAVKNYTTVTFSVTAGGFSAVAADGTRSFSGSMPPGVTITGWPNFPVNFSRRGFPDNNATATITLSNTSGATQTVALLISGHARIQ